MKLSTVRRISKENLDPTGKSLPAWVDNLLSPLNDYLEKMYIAVSGRLTFSDNLYSSTITVSFTHNTAKRVATGSNSSAVGCLLVNSNGTMVTGFNWVNSNTGEATVTVLLSGASSATCTIIFLFK